MVASMASCISSQPGDTLLSIVNAKEGDDTHTKEYVADILKKEGIKGFFVGMRARFYHVGLIVTIQLFMYDFIKRLCGAGSTGL